MKIKYECDYCLDVFDDEEECKSHESDDCSDNPKVKSCKTCKNETTELGGTNSLYYGCKKGVVKTSRISLMKHCSAWEYDEGYAHTGS